MRKRIIGAVHAKPAINRHRLAKQLGVHWNAIQYHVKILVEEGALAEEILGRERELFLASVPGEHRRIVSALHDEDKSQLWDAIVAAPGQSGPQLGEDVDWGKKKTLTRLRQLIDAGLVVKRGTARPRYYPAELPHDLDELYRSLEHIRDQDEGLARPPRVGRVAFVPLSPRRIHVAFSKRNSAEGPWRRHP